MPGIGEEIDGAMQQAPQPGRHSMEKPSQETAGDEGSYPLKQMFETHHGRQKSARLLLEREIQRCAFHVFAGLIAQLELHFITQ